MRSSVAKSSGFTLVELIAVIVIVAVIGSWEALFFTVFK